MDHSELARLYAQSGPFVSAYLDLTGRVENAAQHIGLRWRGLSAGLADRGADAAVLDAVGQEIAAAAPGDATLAVVAAAGSVRFSRRLPHAHGPDQAWHGELPALLPLLRWRQARLPHLVVVIDRVGAHIDAYADGGEPVLTREVVGSNDEIERNAPGGWSQPRYQHRAEDSWDRNAAEVAQALTRLTADVKPRLVLVGGDVRARQFLLDHLPERVRPLVRPLDSEGARTPGAPTGRRAQEVAEHLARAAAADDAALLDRFREERGQHDRAADGPAATLAALSRGQAATVLVADRPDDERLAWFGPDPTAVALDPAPLEEVGVEPAAGRLVDVAARAALGTSAPVRVLAPDCPDGPREGLGAVLRYA